MITDEHITKILYIQWVLDVKYEGKSIKDVFEFIKEHFLNARKNEPTLKECLHGRVTHGK